MAASVGSGGPAEAAPSGPQRRALAAGLVACLLPLFSVAPGSADGRPDFDLVTTFVAGPQITGAVLSGDHLYVTSVNMLSIYDVSNPVDPRRIATTSSSTLVHGELLSTNDRVLLLNDGLRTLEVWDVEDKTNPVPVGRVDWLDDEHVSCVLDCTWAYGSGGSIVDLRRPADPQKADGNWKEMLGLEKIPVHRLDESRRGVMVAVPRLGSPFLIDARDPARPKLIARTKYPPLHRPGFLYAEWPHQMRHRYLFASVEYTGSGCDDETDGALVSFDTKGWPRKDRFAFAGSYTVPPGQCTGYYFSLNPSFEENGLISLPAGDEGIRMLHVDAEGRFEEADFYKPIVSDVWLSFWVDEEIIYLLNHTGEVYVLRYS